VAGVGMTAFGKFLDRSIKSLAAEAVQAAIKDSGMGDSDKGIDTIYYANTASGIQQGRASAARPACANTAANSPSAHHARRP
jgi:acetyl-CoA acyltransferase